ncbi:MAG: ankyrin repeat domain-containing protein [Bdellovibrionales bacterium]
MKHLVLFSFLISAWTSQTFAAEGNAHDMFENLTGIHKAAYDRDFDKIKDLLKEDPTNLNLRNPDVAYQGHEWLRPTRLNALGWVLYRQAKTPEEQDKVFTISKFLLDKGSDTGGYSLNPVYSGIFKNVTALAIAAFGGHTNVVKYLLAQGEDPDAHFLHEFTHLGNFYITPVYLAVMQNHEALARLLIDKYKVDVNFQTYDSDETMIYWTIRNDNYELAKLLVSKGNRALNWEELHSLCDRRVGVKYRTPAEMKRYLDLFVKAGTPIYIQWTEEKGTMDGNDFLSPHSSMEYFIDHARPELQDPDFFRYLIERSPREKLGRSLNWAIMVGEYEMARMLIEHNVPLDFRFARGWQYHKFIPPPAQTFAMGGFTPLRIAIEFGVPKWLVKMLQDRNAPL